MRNSIQTIVQKLLGHKETQNKSCNQLKELITTNGIDINIFNKHNLFGSCFYLNNKKEE